MTPSTVPLETVFEGITQTLTAPAFVLHEDGTFVEIFSNEQTDGLLYDDPQELVGENISEVFSERRADDFHAVITRTLETGRVQEHVYQLQTRTGPRRFAGRVSPLPGDHEPLVLWLAEDRTEVTKLREERLRQYYHLVRTESLANTGGWEFVPSTETLFWTDGTREIFDVPQEFTPSLDSAFDFFVPRDRSRLEEAFIQCLESGAKYDLDVQIVTKRGRRRWLTTRGDRITEDNVTKLVGVVQDITEQKLDEQRLMVLNRVLRHNLRNQLGTLMGYAELLEERLSDETREIFDHIEASAGSLLSLSEKSRRFNHVVEYDYVAGMAELDQVVEGVCSTHRETHAEATITTDCNSVSVAANEVALQLLVEELVGNSLKHADTCAPHVSVTVEQQREHRVSITVADDGPGLPEQERAVLRQGRETKLLHSDGLGLWIVNWIVTKLSGGIHVASNSPRGTIVTVTLPTSTVE